MRRHKTAIAAAAALAMSVSLLAACSRGAEGADTPGDGADASAPPANLFISSNMIGWHVFLGEDDARGSFSEAGLDINVTGFSSGPESAEAFATQDGTMLVAGDLPSVSFVDRHDATIVGQVTSWTGLRFVASKDIQSPQDLVGKRIAVNQGSSTEFWLAEYLAENGIADDVEVIYLDPGSHVPALLKGEIDAAATFLAQALTAIESGEFELLETWPSVLTLIVRNDYLSENPEAVAGVLEVLARGAEEIESDPEGALEAVSGMHGLTDAQYHEAIDNAELDFNPQFSAETHGLLERMARWLVEKGSLPEDYEVCDYVDLSALREVAPDRAADTACSAG
ncbi:transporter substrate-binding domain-containing protein [Georgenia yuyongxinii]|uniref:Transporter substrate-binding domain-containing protein n=1 Tax=Georgenia yuyongxinii TaxID=2589797 RepID=A0A5B8C2P1_9MICO|nr:ABC transporter substrate-binding protein [Georgenia yuyongxinii]QDC24939.1 transporter substrate-binding domain-containing protein [Georgenia yuyongxinii]